MIRFLVFTDLHYDHVPDGDARVEALAARIESVRPDFVLSLGDLCRPIAQNSAVLRRLGAAGAPVHHLVGNHDTDHCPLRETLDFLGMERDFYSFTVDGVRFLMLNAGGRKPPFLPEAQLDWLRQEMEDPALRYVVCSHHSLANDFAQRGVANRKAVRALLETRHTLLCLNGHDHGDACRVIHGIPFFTVNASSYLWHGVRKMTDFPEETRRRYPVLNDCLLLDGPLSAVVEIEGDHVAIRGMRGAWRASTPADIGLGETWNGVKISSEISDFEWYA